MAKNIVIFSDGTGQRGELALHPTVKPVAMVADAIKDVSSRNSIVLDLFGGSGSTLIAAHKTGRRAYLCELDPVYCDRIVQRWQVYAKDDAILQGTETSFTVVTLERMATHGPIDSSVGICQDALAAE